MINNYVTIVETILPRNRVVSIDEYGHLYISGVAKTVYIPDQSSFRNIINKVTVDPSLLVFLGFFEKIVPKNEKLESEEFSLIIQLKPIGFKRIPENEVPEGVNINGSTKNITQINKILSPSNWIMYDGDANFLVSQLEGSEDE